MLNLIYRLYCQFINFIDVEFLDPYDPSEAEKKDCKLFADNVRDVMAAAMKVPKVDADYDDVYFQERLGRNGCQTRYVSSTLGLLLPRERNHADFDTPFRFPFLRTQQIAERKVHQHRVCQAKVS